MIHISFLKTDSLHLLSKPWCKTVVREFHECMLHFFKSHVNTWKPYAIPLRTLCQICLSVCLSVFLFIGLSFYLSVSLPVFFSLFICLSSIYSCFATFVCLPAISWVNPFFCLSLFLFSFVHLFVIYWSTLCQICLSVCFCIFSICPSVCSYNCQSIIISFPIKQFLHYWTLSLSSFVCLFIQMSSAFNVKPPCLLISPNFVGICFDNVCLLFFLLSKLDQTKVTKFTKVSKFPNVTNLFIACTRLFGG